MKTVLAKSLNLDALPALSGDLHNEDKEYDEDNEVKEGNEDEDGVEGVWCVINGQSCVLSKSGTSNQQLHTLARKVRGLEKRSGKALSFNQYQALFRKWESASKPFLRSENDYLSEFLAKLSLVKIPEGETLEAAFKKAQGSQPPAKLQKYPVADVRLFGSLCRELHTMSKGQAIMLAQKSIAKLFNCTHQTISIWIGVLKTLGMLELVKRGSPGKPASTYFYQE